MSVAEVEVTRADYSYDQKTAAIALYRANGGNLKRTATELNLPANTLRYWIETGIDLRPLKDTSLTDKLDKLAHQCADQLPDMLPSASVREVVGALGQSIQLSQLLKGLPTSITETIDRDSLLNVIAGALAEIEVVDIRPRTE